MSRSPFPYTCELCGAEGLTDEGMRSHTLAAHAPGPECPFCDCDVPPALLAGHVQTAHLQYLTPERELMAFIDDQSPSFDDDSKMATADSCSYNTPGSINGWHSPDVSSYHNGAISKNTSYHNGYQDSRHEKEDFSTSPKNINLCNGFKNVNISNEVTKKTQSRQNSNKVEVNGSDKKGVNSSPIHNNGSYEGSPDKKLTMAGAGQGSPLRSQLALKLKANTPKKAPSPSPTVQCLLCDFTSTCPRKLEEHINRAHFDLTSPSVLGNANANSENPTLGLTNPTITLTNAATTLDNRSLDGAMAVSPGPSAFQCPICERYFGSGSDVEVHVNVDHREILSPQRGELVDNAPCDDVVMMEESPVSSCPVCCRPLPLTQHELLRHIEEHFERGEGAEGAEGGAARDARRCEEAEGAARDARRCEEAHEFQLLKAQYGMEEDEEAYSSRAANSLKRAVYSGALSVAGYYERSVGLHAASATGREAAASRTDGLLERIAQLNDADPSIVRTHLCSAVEHYASTYGDRGWGCGYRNMQMVLSSLLRDPALGGALRERARGGAGGVPSIPELQLLVESAWQKGFDTQGSEQLGCKLRDTRKWIGACEVATVLSSLRIRCQLIDFHCATGADGAHPALFEWVRRYLGEAGGAFRAPLYLQHQGHSRTVIGYEERKDGKASLLVLDPSHSPAQVRQIFSGNTAASTTALRLLRRNSKALRARQYQLLSVSGLVATDDEYEASKVLQSVRIP